ncbi:MAG: SDR family NAD(P)-dependent oxidoreductase [Acidobacteriota bacterium]|nr:SDR family NAD(P)-dependent oxidoreductase [Acidobacteriota bacterium]
MSFWKDKVILLTGASSGIGEALAFSMAERGAVLGLVARREKLLKPIKEKIEANGGTARYFVCDVMENEKLFEAAESLRNEFGKIDIMIANAGIGGNNTETRNLEPDAVAKVININLLGAVNSVAAVLPEMLEKKSGQLVAVSSLAGFRGIPKSAAYSASKAGMTAFFESVRLDVQHKGVAVTIIQPGFIKTPLTSGRANKMPFIMELEDAIPLFLNAIEDQKKFAAFPWQLASFVKLGKIFPAWLYDKIAGRARYRE